MYYIIIINCFSYIIKLLLLLKFYKLLVQIINSNKFSCNNTNLFGNEMKKILKVNFKNYKLTDYFI